MGESDDEEWEYEYDDNETEDFFIPIDLANVPAVQGALGISGSTQKGHPTLLRTKLRALDAERREAESHSALHNIENEDESIGKIQISDLHTESPLMMYNGQLLSCDWSKVIGTDFIFAKPSSGSNQAEEPLRALPSVDLLATGSARLVARVAQMRPKDELFNEDPGVEGQAGAENMEGSSAIDVPATDNEGTTSVPVAAPQFLTSTPAEAPAARPAPASFLERLNEIKAKRGEKSRLGVSNPLGGMRLATLKEGTTTRPGDDIVMGGT